MPSTSPVPLPTPPVPTSYTHEVEQPSEHTTMDPYSIPQNVFVQKKRRNPPPLQMPADQQQPGSASPMMGGVPPQQVNMHGGVVPSPHHPQMMQQQMPHEYMGYHHPHSPTAMPQYPQAMHDGYGMPPHSPHVHPGAMGHPHHPHMGGPMTPMTPMVMTPMSGPHPGGFEGVPPPPPHAHHVVDYSQGVYMGMSSPMTPMTPMTNMSFLSDSSVGMNQHQQTMAMMPTQHPTVVGPILPMQYSMGQGQMQPQQQQGMFVEMEGHSPMSPTMTSVSGQNTPTYAHAYAPTGYEMGYAPMQAQPQPVQYQQVQYGYDGTMYTADGAQVVGTEGEMWVEGMDKDNRLRRHPNPNRPKKDENTAVDAMRYKTKMCRNWELTNRCPYGPRCLFAHGRCEMRTTSANSEAIVTAARSNSPRRAFYEQGRFPDFVPVPSELMAQPTPVEIATQQA